MIGERHLTSAARKNIPPSEFALPGRRYPIEDKPHARNALSRVSTNGTPEEKAEVRRKVHAEYPSIGEMSASELVNQLIERSQQ